LPDDYLIGDLQDAETHVFVADVSLGVSSGLEIIDIGPKTLAGLKEAAGRNRAIFWDGEIGYLGYEKSRVGTLDMLGHFLGEGKASNLIFGEGEMNEFVKGWEKDNGEVLSNKVEVRDDEMVEMIEYFFDAQKGQKNWNMMLHDHNEDFCQNIGGDGPKGQNLHEENIENSGQNLGQKFEIFVGGLPSDSTKESMLEYFQQFGPILDCSPQFWSSKSSKGQKCRGY